jgi:uncharacterized protein YlzI (FlbEa/FlbD family)
MRQAQPQLQEADMLKLSKRNGGDTLVLNPLHIQSIRNMVRERGAEVVMATGARHEVQESAETIHQMIEDLRQ